jgi:hypothetical protein
MTEISDALKLIIRQRGGRKRISMEVYLCRTSANFLLWRSQEDDILNVATNAIVMVVFLIDNRLLMAENSISFRFDKMTYIDAPQSVTRSKLGYKETEGEVRREERESLRRGPSADECVPYTLLEW